MLGQRLRSPRHEVAFQAEIDVHSLSYFRDHRVFGTAILPAAAFLDAALSAAAAAVGADHVLEDVTIQQPLVADDSDVMAVQTIVTPGARGASVEIFSQRDGDERWTLHLTGRLARRSGAAPASIDLDALRDRCPEEITAEAHYALLRERGLDFGPSLQGVRRVWKGPDEVLGEIVLPPTEVRDAHHHRIHPALLDACLQVLAALAGPGGDTYLPIGVERMVQTGTATTAAWSHVTVVRPSGSPARPETLTAHVHLFDDVGRSLAVIEGVHLKRADERALLRLGRSAASDDWLYEVTWRPLEPGGDEGGPLALPAPRVLAETAAAEIEALRGDTAWTTTKASSMSWRHSARATSSPRSAAWGCDGKRASASRPTSSAWPSVITRCSITSSTSWRRTASSGRSMMDGRSCARPARRARRRASTGSATCSSAIRPVVARS